jgi:hypothetical protein
LLAHYFTLPFPVLTVSSGTAAAWPWLLASVTMIEYLALLSALHGDHRLPGKMGRASTKDATMLALPPGPFPDASR